MGVSVWLLSGGAAFLLARFVPAGAMPNTEAVATFLVANLAGLAATALDFGGWREADWRAGAFVFFCVAAAIGVIRLVALRAAR